MSNNPVVGLIGSRQTGKTTLAKQVFEIFKKEGPVRYFDLEHLEDRQLLEDSVHTLNPLQGLVVINEIQHRPHLFKL